MAKHYIDRSWECYLRDLIFTLRGVTPGYILWVIPDDSRENVAKQLLSYISLFIPQIILKVSLQDSKIFLFSPNGSDIN